MKFVEVKIARLKGAALDWAVAKAVGQEIIIRPVFGLMTPETLGWRPSADWSQGGPLLDEFDITFCKLADDVEAIAEGKPTGRHRAGRGPNRLIAAMRAIVAAHAEGGTVEVPADLVQEIES